ncbi:MFS transporter [Superficieibacter electus]|uniref:MFS transporter n=1 Tax=Superficieibacter electus TaxID=2022662 RepID=A0A2P5GVS7_9ENTR|nr:MFS transporter [Superficieibacter electus]POP47655.1 MFS transporter [Superficieibacter electus]POP50666.1 MFS transporter [Superficieibacter electus]
MSYTYDSVSIEEVPINRFHQLLTVRSSGGWLMDGYVLSIIGVALTPLAAGLALDSYWQGLIAISALIGICIGSPVGGWLTDRLGRKKLYFAGPALCLVCSLAQFWVETGTTLFILRLLIGVGIGIEYPVSSSLLVEFMPQKQRGPRLAMLTLVYFLGAALAYVVGNLLMAHAGPEGWRFILASPAVIGAAFLLLRLGSPESPRWLLSKGRDAEAEQVIQQVYGPTFSLRNLPEQPAVRKSSFGAAIKAGYGKRLLFTYVFWICSAAPVVAIYSFAPRLLAEYGLNGNWLAWGSVTITVMFVIGCAGAMQLINAMGRRSMVIHSFLWSGLVLIALGLISGLSPLLIVALFSAYAIVIGGTQALQMVYPNELFPTEIRAFAVGLGSALARVGGAVAAWLVPVSLQTIGVHGTTLGIALFSVVGCAVAFALAPETGSMSLQDAASIQR